MTYCLGIVTKHGLVMASDSRTNAGADQINMCSKMHTFVKPGQRVFVILSAGSLSLTQSVITLLKRDFAEGKGLAVAATMYDAARVVGEQVRRVSALDREALERDKYQFNVSLLLGGQIKGEKPGLFMIYPQGNPLEASREAPFLQVGETKYGRPILDRSIRFDETTLEQAAKAALLSLDSTMKSNVTVGPPIDLMAYKVDELEISSYRRFGMEDPDWNKMRARWEQALRQAVSKMPNIRFKRKAEDNSPAGGGSIEFVEPAASDGDAQTQQGIRPKEGKG